MLVNVIMQGTLLKVKTSGHQPPPHEPPQRGEVSGFSKKSRKRLLELFASLEPIKKSVFITLTYPKEFPDVKTAKSHLRAFLERIRRLSASACGVWRLEFQKRGAPHFHLIMWRLPFIKKEDIQAWWGEIIGASSPFTRIELILNNKKLMSYCAKYIAKPTTTEELEGECGFNLNPYLHAGRVWGCFRKELFPFAEPITAEIEMEPEIFLALREVAKTIYPKLYDEYPYTGFTLFMADPIKFLDYTHQLMDMYAPK